MDEKRAKRLEVLKRLAEQSVQRDEDGRLNIDKIDAPDQDMMDDILLKKQARIREILRKQNSGEDLRERLMQKEKLRDLQFQGMTEEEIEEWAAEQKEKMRQQFEALK